MLKGVSRTCWQRVKQLGPYSHSSQSNTVPWQVEDNDGNMISDRAAVLNPWQCDFSSLLNHVQDDLPDHLTLAANINNEHAIDTGSPVANYSYFMQPCFVVYSFFPADLTCPDNPLNESDC